jgi:heme-degrading monooxygenase HmoA
MYAVLIEVDVNDVDEEQGLRVLREQIVPSIKQLPGFHAGTWLPGNDEGEGLSLTVWDSREHAETMADRFGIGSAPTTNAWIARCEVREVAAIA